MSDEKVSEPLNPETPPVSEPAPASVSESIPENVSQEPAPAQEEPKIQEEPAKEVVEETPNPIEPPREEATPPLNTTITTAITPTPLETEEILEPEPENESMPAESNEMENDLSQARSQPASTTMDPASNDVEMKDNFNENPEPTDIKPDPAAVNTHGDPSGVAPTTLASSESAGQPLMGTQEEISAEYDETVDTQQRDLRVQDALAYLDLVKMKFSSNSSVYTHFLEIMKDFKAQNIDTPGVIERVSTLFLGHKDLILGFNTFLPPQCKILDAEAETLAAGGRLPNQGAMQTGHMNPAIPDPQVFLERVKQKFQNEPDFEKNYEEFYRTIQDFKDEKIDRETAFQKASVLFHGDEELTRLFRAILQQKEPEPPGAAAATVQGNSSVMTGPVQPPMMNVGMMRMQPNGMPEGQQVYPPPGPPKQIYPQPTQTATPAQQINPEEYCALHYVTKIKQRFQSQPEIYKHFLDILHTYQKEQKTIREVYDQVSQLFHSHPDLLREFAQFLPHPSGQIPGNLPPPSQSEMKGGGRVRGGKVRGKDRRTMKQRRPSKEMREPVQRGATQWKNTVTNSAEMSFFGHVRMRLNNEDMYEEFLKCLNLFSMEILSKNEFVLLMQDLLGATHPELFQEFKRFVSVDEEEFRAFQRIRRERDARAQRQQHASQFQEIDWASLKKYGPSYRALPKDYPLLKATSRTPLCDEVLNDFFVSVATGEEGGFASVRHNQYMEAQFRCEDDRYELDMVIDANISTVRCLEPYAHKIKELPTEQRGEYRLPDPEHVLDIVHRTSIQRIYGEHYQQIIDGIKRNPSVAIPIVLKRLQQKDQEWQQARREWNRTWSDVSAQNFHRALDYQAFDFKNRDKKLLTAKNLVNEMKDLRLDAKDALEDAIEQGTSSATPEPQKPERVAQFGNAASFRDSRTLVFHGARFQGCSNADRENINEFWSHFVDVFLGRPDMTLPPMGAPDLADLMPSDAPAADTRAKAKEKGKDSSATTTSEAITNATAASTVTTGESAPTQPAPETTDADAMDLDLPTDTDEMKAPDDGQQAEERHMKTLTPSDSVAGPDRPVTMNVRHPEVNHFSTVHASTEGTRADQPSATHLLFADSSLMVFFRMLEILQSRLMLAQELVKKVKPLQRRRDRKDVIPANPTLESVDPFPGDVEAVVAEADKAAEEKERQRPLYDRFLRLVMCFISNMDIDVAQYEDDLRDVFGNDAYHFFTMDRVVGQLVKQIVTLTQDEKSQRMLELFAYECQRSFGQSSEADPLAKMNEAAYLSNAMALMPKETLYRLEVNLGSREMSMHVIDSSPLLPPLRTVDDRWAAYVQSYIHGEVSGFGDAEARGHLFLNPRQYLVRSLRNEEQAHLLSHTIQRNGLECCIQPQTYKMRYVQNTHDFFYRPKRYREERRLALRALRLALKRGEVVIKRNAPPPVPSEVPSAKRLKADPGLPPLPPKPVPTPVTQTQTPPAEIPSPSVADTEMTSTSETAAPQPDAVAATEPPVPMEMDTEMTPVPAPDDVPAAPVNPPTQPETVQPEASSAENVTAPQGQAQVETVKNALPVSDTAPSS